MNSKTDHKFFGHRNFLLIFRTTVSGCNNFNRGYSATTKRGPTDASVVVVGMSNTFASAMQSSC